MAPEQPTPDYYLVLGVVPDASADEIRSAYRRIIRQAHPDAGGTDARFRLVHNAYEVLGDDERRGRYDERRAPAAPATPKSPRPTAAARPPRAPITTIAPDAGPAPSTSGCMWPVLLVAAVSVVIVIVIVLVVALGGSGPTSSNQRASNGSVAPTVGTDVAIAVGKRWRQVATPTLRSIVANGNDLGGVLSAPDGAIDVGSLHEVCRVRNQLLDALESTDPRAPDDVAGALARFLSSERRAMSACLASPPDIKLLGDWGERAQPDLLTVVNSAADR